jgi:hypothetical protein
VENREVKKKKQKEKKAKSRRAGISKTKLKLFSREQEGFGALKKKLALIGYRPRFKEEREKTAEGEMTGLALGLLCFGLCLGEWNMFCLCLQFSSPVCTKYSLPFPPPNG